MNKSKDYYQVLQVQPDADLEVIKAAYRSLSKKYHPDLNSTAQAEEQMKLLNEAYNAVCDPERRQAYDQQCATTQAATKTQRTTSATKTTPASTPVAPKKRPSRPRQRKDWLDDDYAYPHRNPVQTVQASARDFSQVNPRARDYKFRSVTGLGRQLEQAILTYGPLDAWWLARHVSNSHTVGIVSKGEVSAALNSGQGRIFKIAWTDNGKPIWDLVI